MAKRIVIVDDDRLLTEAYVRALHLEGYDVRLITSVSQCKKLLQKKKHLRVDMFIVDLVMPPGKSFPGDECSGGTFTGLFLAHDLRKKYKSTPIVLYSFTSFRYVTAQAKRVAKILRRCAFVRKADYPPVKLVEFIGHYFERGRFPSGILRRLVDSLVVEPNVHGVGIDLKKLIDNDRS
ncbi:MAG: hypothetical protein DME24_14850 [Verrucomicrobia bacterium]|nr:MAG: hypothetical protein DME24_14850 [Verrucomicrobiota bacterium]